MTEQQALRWARKRYGTTAHIESLTTRLGTSRMVGVIRGLAFEVRGDGSNWQEACDNAAGRARGKATGS